MAIASSAAELLFKINKKIKFHGHLLQIGNQNILFSNKKLLKLIKKYRINIKTEKIENEISSEFFFKLFNFSNVQSIDKNKYENASIIKDLNYKINKKFYNKFDAIYDGGSLEHVFNPSEALFNITRMLKKNGYVMHLTPCNNYMDHGFYSISPTLYKDFYAQNNFKIIEFYLVKQNFDLSKDYKWSVYEYDENIMSFYDKWGWKNHRVMVWMVAQKITSSSKVRIPVQSKYIKVYKKKQKKTKNDFKSKLKKKFPNIFFLLKKHHNNTIKIFKDISNSKDKKNLVKPKLLFKC